MINLRLYFTIMAICTTVVVFSSNVSFAMEGGKKPSVTHGRKSSVGQIQKDEIKQKNSECVSSHEPNEKKSLDSEFSIPFPNLPAEISQHVFSFLPLKDLLNAATVSKSFLRIVSQEKLRRAAEHEWITNWNETGKLEDWTGSDSELKNWIALSKTKWEEATPAGRKLLIARYYAERRYEEKPLIEAGEEEDVIESYPRWRDFLNKLGKDEIESLIKHPSEKDALLAPYYKANKKIQHIVSDVSLRHAARTNMQGSRVQRLANLIKAENLQPEQSLALRELEMEIQREEKTSSEVLVMGEDLSDPISFQFENGGELAFARFIDSIEQIDQAHKYSFLMLAGTQKSPYEGVLFNPLWGYSFSMGDGEDKGRPLSSLPDRQ